jgi:glycerol-3-phosphate acyltransferase PlsY
MMFVLLYSYPVVMLGALGIIIGHNFPVWLKFKGGRGLAPGAGFFLVANYFIVIGWCIIWLIVFSIKRKVLISNTLATFSLSILVVLTNILGFTQVNSSVDGFSPVYFTVFSLIITIVILVKHKEVFSANKTLINKASS